MQKLILVSGDFLANFVFNIYFKATTCPKIFIGVLLITSYNIIFARKLQNLSLTVFLVSKLLYLTVQI
jgi:hypothetical protein